MIRWTTRQYRTEAVVSFALLAALGVVLVSTRGHLANVNEAFQRACKAAGDCAATPNPVLQVDPFLQSAVPFIVTITPALIGLFLGAPLLAREFEGGTFSLAWTQSVTRRRWLATKLGLVGLIAIVTVGTLVWIVDWWGIPIDAANQNRFDPGPFAWHGVAPIGYAAFAFALGVSAGSLLRRPVPAMAVTLAGFIAARLAVEHLVRPNLAAARHQSISLASTGHFGTLAVSASTGGYSLSPPQMRIPNDWVLSTAVVDKSGHALTSEQLIHACPGYGQHPNPATIQSVHDACVAELSATFHILVSYQPASRFWPFQFTELAVFLVPALALCGLTYWWVRRRHS